MESRKFCPWSLGAMLQFWYIERGLFLETDSLGIKLNTSLHFKFTIETPKEKGKRKKQKSRELDEGTHLAAEPFCFVKPTSYYQYRIKRQDETVVKQPGPRGLLSFFQFIGGKPREEGLLFSSLRTRRPWGRGQAVSAALSYHPFFRYKSVLKNAFCQLISTRLNAFLAFLLFIVEHSGDKQKRKTKELTKGTLHVTCTFLYPQIESW